MVMLEKPDVSVTMKAVNIKISADKKDLEGVINALSGLKPGREYDVIFKDRARRSLNANSYYWQLVEKIAQANGISKYEVHNRLMGDYGTDWLDESGKHVYVLMKDDDSYLRKQTEHYRPTDATEDRKGTMYRWFTLLLPSHLMDQRQMSKLIEGCVSEAKALNIETRTPEEIDRLVAAWKGGELNG